MQKKQLFGQKFKKKIVFTSFLIGSDFLFLCAKSGSI